MLKNCLSLLCIFLFYSNLFGQTPGTINTIQKISNSSGGLGNVLGSGGSFGNRVANIGDLDGDGVIDLAVGEEYADDGGTDRGAVWVLFMKKDGTVKSKQKISQTSGNLGLTFSDGVRFGFSLAGIGDLDGDGVSDIAVGSVVENSFTGAIWILFLKSDGTVKSTAKIDKYTTSFTSLNTYDLFAFDIANAGDINNDGVTDIIASAPQDDNGGTDRGAVYIIFLYSNGSVKGYQKISDTQGNFSASLDDADYFGSSVSLMGDINGDGLADIVVGAYNDDDGATNAGAIYFLHLKADGTVKGYKKISNNNLSNNNILAAGDIFGKAVAFTSDKNGDGINDVLVGASQHDGGGTDKGAVYLLLLDSSQQVKSYFEYSNSTNSTLSSAIDNGDKFGTSLVSLDNFAQGAEHAFVAGALFDDDGYTNAGAVYMVFLVPPPTAMELEFTKFTLPKDSICKDSFVTARVYLKNRGDADVVNPKVYFRIKSTPIINQNFIYSGTIKAKDSISFNVKLNLINSGKTDITAYVTETKDTIKTNDTAKATIVVVDLIPKFSATNACFGESNTFLNQTVLKGTKNAKYLWDFGDGLTSTDTDPLHTYAADGEYTVSLTVTAAGCSSTYSEKVIAYTPPKILFATNTTCLGRATNLNANISVPANQTPIKSIEWMLGDNNTASGATVSHTYAAAGTYTIKAIVTTATGCIGEYSRNITIETVPQTGYIRSNDTLMAKATNASTYQWYKNGAEITNADSNFYVIQEDAYYTVLVSSAAGCKDSAKSIFESKIKTQNQVTGIIKQSNGQPLKMSLVILASINKTDTIVTNLDTAWTDQNGAYSFTTTQKDFILYAVPTVNLYPNEVLTYYNNSLTVQQADELSLNYGNHTVNFSTTALQAPGGSINITGKVNNCSTCANANKPVRGLSLILLDENKKPVYRLNTNDNGEFIFPSLKESKYYVWADRLFIDNDIAPELEVETDMILPIHVTLHPTKLTIEIIEDTTSIGIDNKAYERTVIQAFPNPSMGKFTIISTLNGSEKLQMYVTSLDGKKIWTGNMTGNSTTSLDLSTAPAGIYLIKVQSANNIQVLKLIKN